MRHQYCFQVAKCMRADSSSALIPTTLTARICRSHIFWPSPPCAESEWAVSCIKILYGNLEVGLSPPGDDAICGFKQSRYGLVHWLSIRTKRIGDVFHLPPPGIEIRAVVAVASVLAVVFRYVQALQFHGVENFCPVFGCEQDEWAAFSFCHIPTLGLGRSTRGNTTCRSAHGWHLLRSLKGVRRRRRS